MAEKFLYMTCFIVILIYLGKLLSFIIKSIKNGLEDIENKKGGNN